MRVQSINPAKLAMSFREEFKLCNVQLGETSALLSDLSTRRDYVQAAFAEAEVLELYEQDSSFVVFDGITPDLGRMQEQYAELMNTYEDPAASRTRSAGPTTRRCPSTAR